MTCSSVPFSQSFLQLQGKIPHFLAISEAGDVPGADSMRNALEEVDEDGKWLEECAHCDRFSMRMMVMFCVGNGENFRFARAAVGAATTR